MSVAGNHLIDLLSRGDRSRLLALCDGVQLRAADVIGEPGQAVSHVYFPIDGFISQLAIADEGPALEVGMIGNEGMLGLHWALGVGTSPLRAVVQGSGASWRLSSAAFCQALAASAGLRGVLLRYAQVCLAQGATSAVCLRYHEIGPRLVRWLLMTEDRAGHAIFPVTQVFLASMLGVRRVGITAAAGRLQKQGLIAYRRGILQVLDRPALLAASCSCYASDQRIYASLMA